MPAISDIPDELRHPTKRMEFLTWLITQPVDLDTRKEIAKLWAADTTVQLDAEHWNFIANNTPV